MSEQNDELKQTAGACGPGCNCGTPPGPSQAKLTIFGLVVLAVGLLAARAIVKINGAPAEATASAFAAVPSTIQTVPPANEPAVAVKELAGLAELNTVAADTDAVFVFLPGKDQASAALPSAPIRAAAKAIESGAGGKVGIFTLKTASPEYAQLAAQVPPPGVLALVKGRGMSAVSGDITEAKLVQAFVGAASAGGCGPRGSSGCCPR